MLNKAKYDDHASPVKLQRNTNFFNTHLNSAVENKKKKRKLRLSISDQTIKFQAQLPKIPIFPIYKQYGRLQLNASNQTFQFPSKKPHGKHQFRQQNTSI